MEMIYVLTVVLALSHYGQIVIKEYDFSDRTMCELALKTAVVETWSGHGDGDDGVVLMYCVPKQ